MKKLVVILLLVSNLLSSQTWQPLPGIVNNINNQRFDDVFFLNENLGWAANGYYSGVYKTTDGGANWTLQTTGAMLGGTHYFRNIEFLDENIGFLGTLNQKFYKTTDGGTTWTQLLSTGTNGDYIWKLQILNSNNNVIFGASEAVTPNPGRLVKSIDGGVTWTFTNAPESVVQAVGFLDENHGWMGGHTTGFYETFDAGITWTNTGVGSNLNRIFFVGSTAYASGTTVYKMSNILSNTDFIEQDRINLNVKVSPNPITDQLIIEIDFLAEDHILIDLYDSNGKLVKKLIKDDINAVGIKKYTFDFPYPTGTYFIDFHTNTGRQSSKIIKR